MKRIFAILCVVFLFLIGCAAAEIEVHFLDVGQGDSTIILCDGESMMIDGGDSKQSSFVYSYLKNTLRLSEINYMIATHPHEDHIGGLSGALNACSVGKVYSPVLEYDSDTFRTFEKYVRSQDKEIEPLKSGASFSVGNAVIHVLSPVSIEDDPNNNSIVLHVQYDDVSFLFTGDAEWDLEHTLLDMHGNLSATALKVAHHGSGTSTSYVFLREVMPKYAIISVGNSNPYGHPSESVLGRLRDSGALVYRTDLDGTIICTSDGHSLNFKTERSRPAESSIAPSAPVSILYIGNKNSLKLHYPECSSVGSMKESNKVFFESRKIAIDDGYAPCKRCNP